MMLETSSPIYTDLITVRTSTDDGDSVYIDGRIRYSMLHSPGHYRTGIQFAGEAEKIGKFVTEMLKPSPIGK